MGDRQAEMPVAGRRHRAAGLLAATLVALLGTAAVPATGLAVVVTVGTPTASFGTDQSISSCSSCTQFQLVAPGYTLSVPAAGRIMTWRASGRGPLALRVLRPSGAGLVAVATTGPTAFAGAGSIPVSLPVAAGDQIGVDLLPTTPPAKVAQLHFANLPGAVFAEAQTAVPDGSTVNAGSRAAGAISLNADVAVAPVATGLDVTSGSTAGGTAVTITGSYLDGTTAVMFGGTPATFTLGPSGQLLVTTPSRGAAGPLDVTVTGPGGTSTLPGAFTYFAPSTSATGGGGGGGAAGGGAGGGASITPIIPGAPLRSVLTIGNLALGPSYFLAARTGPTLTTTPIGTRIAYTLALAATTSFAVQAAVRGRLVPGRGGLGKYCQPTHRAVRPAARCTRYAAIPGGFTQAGRPGPNILRFTGRIAGRTLGPGAYRLTAIAADPHGDRSKPATHAFRILAPVPVRARR